MAVPPSVADAVVRAAAWDDGGLECVYADGTILSFADHMHTFVVVRSRPRSSCTPHPRHPRGQRAAARGAHITGELGRRDEGVGAAESTQADEDGGEGGDEEAGRELCFTAWTLSRDAAKVRAALAIYNALAPQPRLLTTLLPAAEAPSAGLDPIDSRRCAPSSTASVGSSGAALPSAPACGVWREPGPPIHTLLLAKRGDLFRRYPVMGTAREWLGEPSAWARLSRSTGASQQSSEVPCRAEQDRARSGTHLRTADLSVTDPADGALQPPQAEGRSPAPPRDVVVGSVLELWCALRRVRLTVAVHRETFTVRWPAPVTRPDGSRLPPALHVRDAVAAAGSSHAAPLLFTMVEQTFPVRNPPAPWRVMLALALELDATTPKTSVPQAWGAAEDERSACERVVGTDRHSPLPGWSTHGGPITWQGCLPEPQRWSGALNQHRTAGPCRFSPLTAAQAAHVAAPRTSRALAAMRALHPSGAQLSWVYEAPGCGVGRENPPAVHWCLDAEGIDAGATASPNLRGIDALSWVGEDGSVVLTRLCGRGYTVTHHRLEASASASVLYRLQADNLTSAAATADRRLPPVVAPLRCRFPLPSKHTMNDLDVDDGQDRGLRCDPALQPRRDTNTQQRAPLPRSCVPEAQDPVAASALVAVIDASSLRCVVQAAQTRDAPTHERELHVVVHSCGGAACCVTPATACRVLADLGASHASTALAYACRAAPPHAARDDQAHREDLRLGRYLAAIADTAVQFSQVNFAACRDGAAASVKRSKPLLMSAALPGKVSGREAHRCGGHDAAGGDAVNARHAGDAADPVVYLTSQLEGIGTFTALTNGTVRAQFDDRTLLTLIPGANELDEAQLLVSCVLRNATRFTVRAAQCREGHAAYRYLAYVLPFRRYVYWRAVHPDGGDAPTPVHAVAATPSPSSLMEAPLLEASVGHLPSFQSSDLATSFGEVEGRGVEAQAAGTTSGAWAAAVPDSVPVLRAAWGITDTREAFEAARARETAELRARAATLQEVLDANDALSQATRALLRE